MKCPNCNETLVMTDRQGVEIDYCPKCRGVWLDRGELDKIIERSAEIERGEIFDTDRDKNYRDENKYRDDDDYRRKHGQRRKRGFLGDFFDFD
ncbi:MAG TPA: zf-TFIIB domain-containing protein [Chitinophagaceae bacterium]|nr:zf-TFIIB domain-containing protein [Chitinophagaceae bacterium]